ncbi:MAG TPA: diguanylate cyclase, partial [Chitinophagaceae bacterium]|nr:diguanylate cyclase [Chitinophagaceae bacterium]
SSLSQSEIVVAVFKNNQVVAVLDADSATLNSFDETDKKFLEEMVGLLGF